MNVADNSDNGDPRGLFVVAADFELFTDGVFFPPVVLRHGLVDQRHRKFSGGVTFFDGAAIDKLHAKRFHVVEADDPRIGNENISRRGFWLAFDSDSGCASRIRQRNPRCVTRGDNAGKRLHPGEHLIVESHPGSEGLILLTRKRRAHYQNVIGPKTGIEMIEIFETSNQQRGTGEQNNRESNFANHESVA
jgi:hypothetical protein